MRLPHTIETISGLQFDYKAPVIRLEDVAHGLSHVCRFAGHTTRFYSVAEHSILVSGIVESMAPDLALAALWHDAHEAYMGDIATPLKEMVGDAYKDIAARIDRAVCEFLGLDSDPAPLRHPLIKYADEMAMLFEASELKDGQGWEFTRSLNHETCERVVWSSTLGMHAPDVVAAAFTITHRRLNKG